MKLPILPVFVLSLAACSPADRVELMVLCDSCQVRYGNAEEVERVHVSGSWLVSTPVVDGQLIGLHVDSVQHGSAWASVKYRGEKLFSETCELGPSCRISFIGQVNYPWWAKK